MRGSDRGWTRPSLPILMLVVVFALLFGVPSARAQVTIVLPSSSIEFDPSADHNAVDLSGTPVTSGYTAIYYLTPNETACVSAPKDATTKKFTFPAVCIPVSLGKPTPGTLTGRISIPNFFGQLQPNVPYKSFVISSGPGGDSALSNVLPPFGLAVLLPPAPPTNYAIKK